MKRGKPNQEIYRPGSGPLRKTTLGLEECTSDSYNKNNNKSNNIDESKYNTKDNQRKSRKPEQNFYVARGVSQSKDDGNETNGNFDNRLNKRYLNRRKTTSENEQDSWRYSRKDSECYEPRNTHNSEHKSLEKNYSDKGYSKPPSGRRNNMGNDINKRQKAIERLPPRFQKKFWEDNKIQSSEEWNGASLTFQGSCNYKPAQNYIGQGSNAFYNNTLPNMNRGRGRYNPEQPPPPLPVEVQYRPRTPEHVPKNVQPQNSPIQRNILAHPPNTNRNLNQIEELPKFRKSLEEQLSSVSPPSPEEIKKIKEPIKITTNTVLDWSEEVELNDKLEAEAVSDLTPSSSVASLVDVSKINTNPIKKSRNRKSGRKNKKRSGSLTRDNKSHDIITTKENNGSNKTSTDSRRQRRPSNDRNYDRHRSRDYSFDRNRRASTSEPENWREENRLRQNLEKKPGVIVLPSAKAYDHYPKYHSEDRKLQTTQKTLYDHNNPDKPIIIKSSQTSRVPGFSDNAEVQPPQLYTTDQFGNIRPAWYDEQNAGFKSCRYPGLIREIKRADVDLQYIMNSGFILSNWNSVERLRNFLKESLQFLLQNDLKFCQGENVEHHLWKMLYHNIIEVTRKAILNDANNKQHFKGFLLYLIDEGVKYFEELLECLQEKHDFNISDYLGNNNTNSTYQKGSGFVGLALISAQKIFLYLGDLGRYREQVNESSNYGKCRQWYIKAHEINPKNGRPYYQLAILAVYARRKLDAVYYYMRSLMSSNPVQSARESLISLFDENRRKYEQGEKRRREERFEKNKQQMKQKESENFNNIPGSLRHETWIRPDGGRRVYRTTQAVRQDDSEEENLAILDSVEVNKRFVISYLHVHGKLITRIGMETFQETAMQMLKEFRALLLHSPVPLPCNRFLQLLALNMFAIESTQLKDAELHYQSGYRSELQERAIIVSLQMFNLILERCVSLIREYLDNDRDNFNLLPHDIHVLLPAVKIWCDWMLCHSVIWNPPPSVQDFKIGSPDDAWKRLATLMNLLEKLDRTSASYSYILIKEQKKDYESVSLPEDYILNGFTPLMVNEPEPSFAPSDIDIEMAQFSLRIKKLLFFGTVFLCGLEPPVLKLEIEDDVREYVSVVCTNNSRDSPTTPKELKNNDVLIERFSDEDDIEENIKVSKDAPQEIQDLLSRKVELEKKNKYHELHMQRVKKILSQAVVNVHLEILPKYLVPDTNCFIDHLNYITEITASHVYTLMVPIIVLSELEGLSRGGKSPIPLTRRSLDPQHIKKVASAAQLALNFLKSKPQGVKCVTTKGAVLSSTTFTTEDDTVLDASLKNDDKILLTCLALSKNTKKQHLQQQQQQQQQEKQLQPQQQDQQNQKQQEQEDGDEVKKLFRDVVLLTDDRNLRVKAIARDVPVRELTDFVNWAGLG